MVANRDADPGPDHAVVAAGRWMALVNPNGKIGVHASVTVAATVLRRARASCAVLGTVPSIGNTAVAPGGQVMAVWQKDFDESGPILSTTLTCQP